VTLEVGRAVKEIKNGKIEFRTDKVGNIHVPIGKVSFDVDKLKENLQTIHQQLLRIKPSTVKGNYMKNITVSSTMGPGIKILEESI
jgi:large subunit ribosomal protein L1